MAAAGSLTERGFSRLGDLADPALLSEATETEAVAVLREAEDRPAWMSPSRGAGPLHCRAPRAEPRLGSRPGRHAGAGARPRRII